MNKEYSNIIHQEDFQQWPKTTNSKELETTEKQCPIKCHNNLSIYLPNISPLKQTSVLSLSDHSLPIRKSSFLKSFPIIFKTSFRNKFFAQLFKL